MPDRQHVAPFGTKATPASWVLPAALEFSPKIAFARFNGASAAGPWKPCLRLISDAGIVAAECVAETIVAAGGSADVSWFHGVDDDTFAVPATAGVVAEVLSLDTSVAAGVTSTTVLASGVSYLITVQGTYTLWNHALEVGSPNANAMFPTSLAGRASTQVGLDAECSFAYHDEGTGFTLGHKTLFVADLGSGFSHLEPQGGPFGTPQTNYLYRYTVTGQASTVTFKTLDINPPDNYGALQIIIYNLSGAASGGGGGGALLPPDGADYAVVQPLAGVYVWNTALDGGSA